MAVLGSAGGSGDKRLVGKRRELRLQSGDDDDDDEQAGLCDHSDGGR